MLSSESHQTVGLSPPNKYAVDSRLHHSSHLNRPNSPLELKGETGKEFRKLQFTVRLFTDAAMLLKDVITELNGTQGEGGREGEGTKDRGVGKRRR